MKITHNSAMKSDQTCGDGAQAGAVMQPLQPPPSQKFRTLWISDLHLGSHGSQAQDLLRFLRQTEVDQIYLVGDIIDLWALRRNLHWPPEHMEVVRHILARAAQGIRITYIPGNHDHAIRAYSGQTFGQVKIEERAIHLTADGRRILVMHGDEFDQVLRQVPWLAHVGDILYDLLRSLNRFAPKTRKNDSLDEFQPQTLSARTKHRIKQVVHFLSRFERQVERHCTAARAQGIVCGHSHHAEISRFRGILYCNDGDWVESRTALVEHHNGQLELLRWPAIIQQQDALPQKAHPVVSSRA